MTIKGSFAQIDSFERALNYLDNGRIKVNEIVTQEIPLKDWGKALDLAWERQGIKTALFRGSTLPITGGCRRNNRPRRSRRRNLETVGGRKGSPDLFAEDEHEDENLVESLRI